MFLSAVLFSMMAILVKYTSDLVPAPEIMFFRSAISFLIILFIALLGKADIKPRSKGKLLFRGIIGAVSLTLYFYGISLTTLSNAILLAYTYPIFGAMFSAMYLDERLTKENISLILLAIIGVAMIFNFDFSNINIGDALALISGITSGMAITAIRELRRTDSSWAIVFSFVATASVTSLILTGFDFVVPTLPALFLLTVLGTLGTFGQLFMTYAYKHCSTALGGVISMSSVVMTSILSYFIFHEKLTLLMLFGGILIFLSAAIFSSKEECAEPTT